MLVAILQYSTCGEVPYTTICQLRPLYTITVLYVGRAAFMCWQRPPYYSTVFVGRAPWGLQQGYHSIQSWRPFITGNVCCVRYTVSCALQTTVYVSCALYTTVYVGSVHLLGPVYKGRTGGLKNLAGALCV